MPTVQVEAHISSKELLAAADQLNKDELAEFIQQVSILRAKRIAPNLSQDEANLLLKINQGIPDHVQIQFNELRLRLKNNQLINEEHAEYLQLVDQIEKNDAARIEYLAQLAQIRQTSVADIMDELGISPPLPL